MAVTTRQASNWDDDKLNMQPIDWNFEGTDDPMDNVIDMEGWTRILDLY